MKKLILLIIIQNFFVPIYSQTIPNMDFETWEGNNPAGWFTSNILSVYVPITQSTDAHGGIYAVKGTVLPGPIGGYPPLMSAGMNEGFPINFRPEALHGWYKFNSDSGDAFSVTFAMIKNHHAIGSGGFFSANNETEYKQFSANVIYQTEEIPDTIQIYVTVTGNPFHIGTTFYLDDLFYGPATGVDENTTNRFTYKLEQNYPNPFNPITNFGFQIARLELVSLKVYDLLGNEIATLVNEEKPAGDYSIKFDASGLASGVYYYTLRSGSFTETKKMVVIK